MLMLPIGDRLLIERGTEVQTRRYISSSSCPIKYMHLGKRLNTPYMYHYQVNIVGAACSSRKKVHYQCTYTTKATKVHTNTKHEGPVEAPLQLQNSMA